HASMSDYAWAYVNRVAAEVYKTHPATRSSCYAYGTYLLPPQKIEKLSPNVLVGLVHGRRGNAREPSTRGKLTSIQEAWRATSSHALMIWEHYVFTHRGTFWPAYFPPSIRDGLAALKGTSLGEVVEVAWGPGDVRGHGLHRP